MPLNGFEAVDLPDRVGNIEAYARLFKIWEQVIVVNGPPQETVIGRFSLSSPPTSVWEVYAIAPKPHTSDLFVRSVIDAVDDGTQKVMFDPVMLITKCGSEIWWIDVVNFGHFRSRQKMVLEAANYVAASKGSNIGGIGP